MRGSALATLQEFRSVEEHQQYTRLVEIFADDAVYYDPFYGPQRGTDAIRGFMEHMEKAVPASGASFANWHIEADTDVGWADWEMMIRGSEGAPVAVPGQSLYRLRDGRVTFVADYIDTRAWRRVRGDDAQLPDHASSLGISALAEPAGGAAFDVITRYWEMQDAGRGAQLGSLFSDDGLFVNPLRGTFTGRREVDDFMGGMAVELPSMGARCELVDVAGDDTVGWAQWWFHLGDGKAPCWTLFTVRQGEIDFARDVFDMAVVRDLATSI